MKVLLTGATGFLGKYVIEELKNNSYQVVAFGRNEKIGKTLIDENVEFFKGDIDNLDDLYKASQDCTAVIHAAAPPSTFKPFNFIPESSSIAFRTSFV